MKKTIIVALVCLNLVLLATLVAFSGEQAQAQTERGGRNYLMVSAMNASGRDAVWVLDMRTRWLAALTYDPTAKRIIPYGVGRSLKADFKRAK